MTILNRKEVTDLYYGSSYKQLFDLIRDKHLELYGEKPDNEYYHEINIIINEKLYQQRNFGHKRKKNCTNDELNGHKNLCSYLIDCINEQKIDPKETIINVLEVY